MLNRQEQISAAVGDSQHNPPVWIVPVLHDYAGVLEDLFDFRIGNAVFLEVLARVVVVLLESGIR